MESNANAMPSLSPSCLTRASSSRERSSEPNFCARYCARGIPSAGIDGLSWNGSQRISALTSPFSAAIAFPRRRLPM
jgi:hypothetical protein